MNTNFKTHVGILISIAVVASFFVTGSTAFAQRDAGAKARGEFGRGFWNSNYRTGPSRGMYYFQQPAIETRESFSYAPAAPDTSDGASSTVTQPRSVRRSFSFEPAEQSFGEPSPWRRPRSPIERRLRPGGGFWSR